MRIIIELDDKIQSNNMAANVVTEGLPVTNIPTTGINTTEAINAGVSKAQQSENIQDHQSPSISDLDSTSGNIESSEAINAGVSKIFQ